MIPFPEHPPALPPSCPLLGVLSSHHPLGHLFPLLTVLFDAVVALRSTVPAGYQMHRHSPPRHPSSAYLQWICTDLPTAFALSVNTPCQRRRLLTRTTMFAPPPAMHPPAPVCGNEMAGREGGPEFPVALHMSMPPQHAPHHMVPDHHFPRPQYPRRASS